MGREQERVRVVSSVGGVELLGPCEQHQRREHVDLERGNNAPKKAEDDLTTACESVGGDCRDQGEGHT